jgi:hypothetical protein
VIGLKGKELLGNGRVLMLGLHASLHAIIALLIKYELRINQQSAKKGGKAVRNGVLFVFLFTFFFFLFSCLKIFGQGRKATVEYDWMPYVGNIASILSFFIFSFVEIYLLSGSSWSIFFICPILLFLNQDDLLFSDLTDSNRYFPLAFSVICYFVFDAVWNVLTMANLSLFSFVKNLLLLSSAIPSQYYFLRFLWDFTDKRGTLAWMVLTPLAVLTLLSEIQSILILGLLAGIGTAVQYFWGQQLQKLSRKII